MSLFPPATCPRLIVKIGSALLVDPDGGVRRAWLEGIAADIAARAGAGQQVAVVSSGAIALGARRLGLPKGGRASLEDAQAAAAAGQIALAGVWAEVLGHVGLTAAQMLVTLGDLEERRRYLNAAATLGRLLQLGVVPVINENDSVSTEEIRFGDNDRLAARIARAAGAAGVVLLSDIDGLYDRNPALPGAVHVPPSGVAPPHAPSRQRGSHSVSVAFRTGSSHDVPLTTALSGTAEPLYRPELPCTRHGVVCDSSSAKK